MTHINAVSFSILVVLFAMVAFVGFAAARWRRGRGRGLTGPQVPGPRPPPRARHLSLPPQSLVGLLFAQATSW